MSQFYGQCPTNLERLSTDEGFIQSAINYRMGNFDENLGKIAVEKFFQDKKEKFGEL